MFYLLESYQPSSKELLILYLCKRQLYPGVDSRKSSSMKKFDRMSAIPSNLPPLQWLEMPRQDSPKIRSTILRPERTLRSEETVMRSRTRIWTARTKITRGPKSVGTGIRPRSQMIRVSGVTIALRRVTKATNVGSRRGRKTCAKEIEGAMTRMGTLHKRTQMPLPI